MFQWISEFLGFALMVGVPALVAVAVLKWADGYDKKRGDKIMYEYGQIVNILKFINQYCEFTSFDDSQMLDMLGKFASAPKEWDISLIIDREYDVLTFDCWTRNYGSISISADVDFDEIARDYDLDNLTYEVCNKGLN